MYVKTSTLPHRNTSLASVRFVSVRLVGPQWNTPILALRKNHSRCLPWGKQSTHTHTRCKSLRELLANGWPAGKQEARARAGWYYVWQLLSLTNLHTTEIPYKTFSRYVTLDLKFDGVYDSYKGLEGNNSCWVFRRTAATMMRVSPLSSIKLCCATTLSSGNVKHSWKEQIVCLRPSPTYYKANNISALWTLWTCECYSR